ncbi:DEAD/DEAH box helicase [Butyrivibrio sp. VCB2006]|uniref:DEAD/DEAH box helicase n=1 Tax=Butyrivibrio sp. VCB2006 TaxID=1280679 RepID=UPI0003FB3E65|nr:DEAD/DEAH box helicase [Butyrivibrio sp. VCB2006]
MDKPNFKDLKKLIKAIDDTNATFKSIYNDRDIQANNIKHLCNKIAGNQARKDLCNVSVDELKNAKAGIRVQALIDAGYTTFGQIVKATDYEIQAVDGIGEKQTEAIRNVITEFANSLASRVTIRLDADPQAENPEDNAALITEIANYLNSEKVRKEALEAAQNLDVYALKIKDSGIIRNGVHWIFSSATTKQKTVAMADDIYEFCNSAFFNKMLHTIDLYQEASHTSQSVALESFNTNSADFYALLESLGNATGNKPFVYDSIPAQLAEEINETQLNLDEFCGTLRAYQAFGAKYILHQNKVLLGDEMGLGKTIQAIAAMSHIQATKKDKCHFLIVCPASVLINWARELKKFSRIEAYIVHGQTLEDSFNRWRENGGAAITNYESMGKIVDRIDNHMSLAMLVIDEAHYMKNPDAKRTMYIRRLDNESERILLMTGTPLENRVDEMCNLIDFVRPDMTKEVKELANISHLPQFKESLAPVYIRRTRQQVLKELPEIAQEQEWCSLTDSDRDAYKDAILSGSFSDMRRVSFLQDDMATSSKCARLLELLDQARDQGRKVIIYSFYKETISKVSALLGSRCIGVISGDTKMATRQFLVDKLADAPGGSVLVSQIIAGGVGLNIQAASIVVFCEPQIKPSLESQALSRVYRMGQVRNVLVYRLLCPDTIDDQMMLILDEKQMEFDNYADESVVAGAFDNIMDKEWITKAIEQERQKYLPAVYGA